MKKVTPHTKLTLLASTALMLAACNTNPTPDPPPTPTEQEGKILGQISPWKAGDATAVKYALNNTDTPLAQAPVDATGKFTLNLPKHSEVTTTHKAMLLNTNDVFGLCENVTNTSTAGLMLLPVNSLYTNEYKRLILRNSENAEADDYKAWWFAERDGKLVFKGDCFGIGKVDVNLDLKRGWNVLNVVQKAGVSTTYTLTTQPTTTTTWTYYVPKNAMQALSLKNNVFEPWKNLPKYQGR